MVAVRPSLPPTLAGAIEPWRGEGGNLGWVMYSKSTLRTVAAGMCLAALSATAASQEDARYQQLARQPQSHIGKIFYFRGKATRSKFRI